jgi:diacylglycerol kinase (ATP)
VDEIGGAEWSGTVYPTHATELARQAAEDGYECVIAVGGDGTVHEVINGLMQVPQEHRPKLGVVPLGTGNDFAYGLGVPRSAAQALRHIKNAIPHRVDLGRLRDGRGRVEYWDNTMGIGFDTTVTLRSRKIPFIYGFPSYLLAVIQTILLDHDAPNFKITTDQENWSEELLALVLCNGSREGGGFLVSPQAKMDDGFFNFLTVKNISRPRMFRLVPEIMKGTHERFPEVSIGTFHQLEVESDRPMYIHTDGEIFAGFGVDVRQLSVEILPGALEVLL